MSADRFRWLHFTDLHVGLREGDYLWPGVEEEVLADLQRVHGRLGGVDAIFFTGDLTQQGDAREFEKFDAILQLIQKKLAALGSSPAFIAVPGNHDLVRPPAGTVVMKELGDWTKNAALRERFWTDAISDYRTTVTAAFQDWSDWAARAISWDRLTAVNRAGLLPGDFAATWERDGLAVGIIGLNTAALQLGPGDHKGKLSVDPRQVSALVGKLYEWVANHDACFVLTHHDASWLDQSGIAAWNAEIAKAGRFALHLCGHRHQQGRMTASEGGAPARRVVIGRSLFGLETYEHEGNRKDRLHGYSGGFIEFGETRTLRLWPRRDEVQQAGHRVLQRDQSDALEADGGTHIEDIGQSPRDSSASAGVQSAHGGLTTPNAGEQSSAAGGQTIKDVIAELAEHYTDRDQIRDIWTRAGGRASDIPHISRIRDLWRELSRLASSGALANPEALVRCALEDRPGNAILRRFLEVDAREPAKRP